METEELRKEAAEKYLANQTRQSKYILEAFIAGAEWEAEREKSVIAEIQKRILLIENSGSKSKAAEMLLFKELDTLKWVTTLLTNPTKNK